MSVSRVRICILDSVCRIVCNRLSSYDKCIRGGGFVVVGVSVNGDRNGILAGKTGIKNAIRRIGRLRPSAVGIGISHGKRLEGAVVGGTGILERDGTRKAVTAERTSVGRSIIERSGQLRFLLGVAVSEIGSVERRDDVGYFIDREFEVASGHAAVTAVRPYRQRDIITAGGNGLADFLVRRAVPAVICICQFQFLRVICVRNGFGNAREVDLDDGLFVYRFAVIERIIRQRRRKLIRTRTARDGTELNIVGTAARPLTVGRIAQPRVNLILSGSRKSYRHRRIGIRSGDGNVGTGRRIYIDRSAFASLKHVSVSSIVVRNHDRHGFVIVISHGEAMDGRIAVVFFAIREAAAYVIGRSYIPFGNRISKCYGSRFDRHSVFGIRYDNIPMSCVKHGIFRFNLGSVVIFTVYDAETPVGIRGVTSFRAAVRIRNSLINVAVA